MCLPWNLHNEFSLSQSEKTICCMLHFYKMHGKSVTTFSNFQKSLLISPINTDFLHATFSHMWSFLWFKFWYQNLSAYMFEESCGMILWMRTGMFIPNVIIFAVKLQQNGGKTWPGKICQPLPFYCNNNNTGHWASLNLSDK